MTNRNVKIVKTMCIHYSVLMVTYVTYIQHINMRNSTICFFVLLSSDMNFSKLNAMKSSSNNNIIQHVTRLILTSIQKLSNIFVSTA